MSFESGRNLGLVASLIAVILPVVTGIFYVFSLLSLLNVIHLGFFNGGLIFGLAPFSAIEFMLLAFGFVGLAGVVLFLIAMRRLSEYYSEPAVYKNALNGFIVNLIEVAAVVSVVLAIFAAAFLHMAIGGLLIGVFGAAIVGFVLAIVSAVFYKRAFDNLAQKSGIYSFNTAGSLYLWGTVLTIVLIGALLVWIAWMFAASGFYSLKPKPPQQTAILTPPLQSQYISGPSKRFCQYCGQENAQDASYCQACGNKIQENQ